MTVHGHKEASSPSISPGTTKDQSPKTAGGSAAAPDYDFRARLGATRLPKSLSEALAALREDSLLMEALGDRLSTSYLAVKELDLAAFAERDEAYEYEAHRFAY